MFEGFARRAFASGAHRVRFVEAGSGPPVLLLHGFPQTRAAWHRVAPRLAERSRDLAMRAWNWFLLAQPAPFPETLAGRASDEQVSQLLDAWAGRRDALSEEARAEYLAPLGRARMLGARLECVRCHDEPPAWRMPSDVVTQVRLAGLAGVAGGILMFAGAYHYPLSEAAARRLLPGVWFVVIRGGLYNWRDDRS